MKARKLKTSQKKVPHNLSLPQGIKDDLIKVADRNKRSPSSQVAWWVEQAMKSEVAA